MQQKAKKQKYVHILTERVQMRFLPTNKIAIKQDNNIEKQKVQKSMWDWWPLSKLSNKQSKDSQVKQASSITINGKDNLSNEESSSVSEQTNQKSGSSLKFALRLSPEHVLIGNQYQLDIFSIGNITANNFVETDYLWSIRKKMKISHVCVQQKKLSLLVIIAHMEVTVYRYDSKKFPTQEINPIKHIKLTETPMFAQIAKDGNICLFFKHHAEIYVITESVRRRYNAKYELPPNSQANFQLLLVPEHFDNYINIFFQQKNSKQATFTLWCLQMQLMSVQIKTHPIQKIYQIKNSLKSVLKLNNYSKQIFLLNLGSQILALKRGYILDAANVTIKKQPSILQYIGNNKLFHITTNKIEVYNFEIKLLSKPSKIIVKSEDSIKIQGIQESQQYFKSIPVLTNDFLIIFQKKPSRNMYKNGQIHYSMFITRCLTREQKIQQLFPKNIKQFKIDDQKLLQKCDMAQKMGYERKQIFLQLWQRSSQSKKQDYSLLIATKDYQTITEQIITKLKKSSMAFKQILKIEEACLEMIREKLYSPSCTYDAVMNYINSHFFIRKLNMFKDIQIMDKILKEEETGQQEQQAFKMTIRQYYFYRNMQIKAQLIQYINQFCHEDRKQLQKQIRFLLRNFKFVFRTIYENILEQIIKNAGDKLLELLKIIPEILPYQPLQNQRPPHIPVGYYDGVWAEISNQEWKQSLYVDAITTIDNKYVVQEQVIKSIPFKRNWLSHHDMIVQSIQKIKKHEENLRSPHIYYFFIAKLFQYIQDRAILKVVIDFLQQNYTGESQNLRKSQIPYQDKSIRKSSSIKQNVKVSKIPGIPQNIIGKVFLMQKIYRFFEEKKIIPTRAGKQCPLSEFFDFQDAQLIKFCFEKQRSIKGLLLKDIKSIYKQCLVNHNQMFNRALLNYFISDLSQVSDLKYLLNRINNQKKDFHKQNREMYIVLVEALQRKLKIGTNNDIPIDQVLIYLENIPLHTSSYNQSETNATLEELKIVQIINKQSQFLRKSKVNMSIYDILRNPEDVFIKLIEHAIKQSPAEVWENSDSFVKFIIAKLSEVEEFSSSIYSGRGGNDEKDYEKIIFFIFLAKLCQNIFQIQFVRDLLKNEYIEKRYDSFTAEQLVQYMYKWALFNNSSFIENAQYIRKLLILIPEQSSTYRFIDNQLQFAQLLSYQKEQITYPISNTILNYNDLKQIITNLQIEYVMTISIEKVYELVKNIQQIITQEEQLDDEKPEIVMDPKSQITLHQVYQIFIIKYLNCNKIKEVLPLIKRILNEQVSKTQNYDIIFPILYILHISGQLNENNKENLIHCVWYYFYQPKQLMEILEYLVETPLSQLQTKQQIENALENGKKKYKGYNPANQALCQEYLAVAEQKQSNSQKFMNILRKIAKHIQESKQEFRGIKYSMIMAMICNSPYALAKFLSCSDEKNVKPIRSILSYAILQDVFDPLALLELVRRVFLVLLQSYKKQIPIQLVIQQFNQIDIHEDMDTFQYFPTEQINTFQSVMWKSAQAFKKKKQALITDHQNGSRISKRKQKLKQKNQKIQDLFQNAEISEKSGEHSQYIFSDSDNDDNGQMEIVESMNKKSKGEVTFVPRNVRNEIFQSSRFKKPCALYKSTQGQFGFRSGNRLFISTSQAHKSSNLQVSRHSGVKSYSKSHRNNKQSQIIDQPPKLRISISHPGQQFEENNLKPGNLEIDSLNQSPAKSSPQLDGQLMKIQSLENQDMDENFDQIVNSIKNCDINKKQSNQNHQKNMQLPENSIKSKSLQEIELGRPPEYSTKQQSLQNMQPMLEQSAEDKEASISDNYQIHVKQVEEMPSDQQQPLSGQKLAEKGKQVALLVLQKNKLKFNDLQQAYDLDCLIYFKNSPQILMEVIKQLYMMKVGTENWSYVVQIISKIVEQHNLNIKKQIFNLMERIYQAQSKTIPEISFENIVTWETFVKSYKNQRQIFQQIYKNISKFIGSENIYTIAQFFRRVFDSPTFDQEIIWDFVLDLCQKLNTLQLEQKQWSIQKIQATLPKIQTSIWIFKYDSFRRKVLQSQMRDELLQIFCNELKIRKQKELSLDFLRRIQSVYTSEKIAACINQIENK